MQLSKQNLKFPQRIRLIVISALAFCVTVACSLWDRRARKGVVTCYTAEPIPETPEVLCYEMVEPTPTPEELTPSPTPVCYTATPSPTWTPTPVAEDQESLLERLLAEERFPEDVARELTA